MQKGVGEEAKRQRLKTVLPKLQAAAQVAPDYPTILQRRAGPISQADRPRLFGRRNVSQTFPLSRRVLSSIRATACLAASSTPGRSCTTTGPPGESGTSTSPWTTSGSTSGRRSPSTSHGSVGQRSGGQNVILLCVSLCIRIAPALLYYVLREREPSFLDCYSLTQWSSALCSLPGFYTGWLLPAAVVGVIVFLYGVFTMYSNVIANETCDQGDQVRR